MLSKRRCPHTGVVNFFFSTDPHLAVGSVIEAGPESYLWRCYTDPFTATGAAGDMKSAERQVADLCRQAAHLESTHLIEAA